MRSSLVAALALLAVPLLAPAPAAARGGHHGFGRGGFGHAGFGHGGFGRGAMHADGAGAFAGDRKHTDDPYVKAALDEEERVLKKLSSICRGC